MTPVSKFAPSWAFEGRPSLVFVAASRSRDLDHRLSQPVAAAVRRAAAASMDPPDAPQPLPSARSKFDAVPHAQPSGASFALSAGTSAPACTLASACVAASCHQAPCRPPLADVRGRARCFLESTAPHQQSTTHAKPPAPDMCIRTYVAMHSCEQSPPFAEQPLKLLPAPGVWGCPPAKLLAFEASGPPRPRGAAGGKINRCAVFPIL